MTNDIPADIPDTPDILDMLHGKGLLSKVNVSSLRSYADEWHTSFFHAIIETFIISEVDLADHLAEILKIDRVYHLATILPPEEALKALGFRRARKWEWFPAGWRDDTRAVFEVIAADPTAVNAKVAELADELGCEIALAVGERSDIVGAIDQQFPIKMQLPALFDDR